MNQQVADYIAALPVEHRLLLERIHGLILEACPGIEVVFAYKMPTYRTDKRPPARGGLEPRTLDLRLERTRATGASRFVTPSFRRAPGRSSCEPTGRRLSPTTSRANLARSVLTP